MSSVVVRTYKARRLVCMGCGERSTPLVWNDHANPRCGECGGDQEEPTHRVDRSTYVLGDEIDRTIEHGLCHADGTPRRFRSRAELKGAERAAGYRLLERGERFPGDVRPRERRLA